MDDPELVRRVAATDKLVRQFRDQPFRLGVRDCVRMTATHLRRLGYTVQLPHANAYRSRRRALELLRERGHANLAAALDALGLERIAPAAALVGDIMALPAVDELGALAIVLGNGRVLGYHELARGAVPLNLKMADTAWRVRA